LLFNSIGQIMTINTINQYYSIGINTYYVCSIRIYSLPWKMRIQLILLIQYRLNISKSPFLNLCSWETDIFKFLKSFLTPILKNSFCKKWILKRTNQLLI